MRTFDRIAAAATNSTERLVAATKSAYRPMLLTAARLRRPHLEGLLVVGVTGSCGKTATKDLVHAVLSTQHPGVKSHDSSNSIRAAAQTLLAVRRNSRFAVVEIAAGPHRELADSVRLLAPNVGVVTRIGLDHYATFRSVEAVAQEKGALIEALPATGTAVLNADDPRVMDMAKRCSGRVLTFGMSREAEIRGSDVSDAWPQRLHLTVEHGNERVSVRTRLCGAHWCDAVLAALAVGVAAGVPLAQGAAAIASVEPFRGRMFPEEHPDGVTFIRDDWKSPWWSARTPLDFLRNASAKRKIAVFGTISDCPGTTPRKYQALAEEALTIADHVIFAGRNAHYCVRRGTEPDPRLAHFNDLRDAKRWLDARLMPGDLVLLKGSLRADHLDRLALSRRREVSCWRPACGKLVFCESCPLVGRPAG